MPWVIEARRVWVSYVDGNPVLRGASLAAERGEVVSLLGPTGSGKTTLLLVLAGLLRPEKGEVLLDGTDLYSQLPGARRRIGLLFQNPDDQLFNPTVYDEIAYSLRTLGENEDTIRERVAAVARLLGIEAILERPPYRLSMGQKRLVALASILVYEPDILLLDEPLTFLDPDAARRVACIVRLYAKKGKTVILATHNVEAAAWLSNKTCILRNGVTHCTTPRELLEDNEIIERLGWLHPTLRLAKRLARDNLWRLIEEDRTNLEEECKLVNNTTTSKPTNT
ncbi:ABC transporter-related protein [Pyrolobus fumarii 1A]|uniref:ABC transporter-related protein n=1 Tax=Pyrolobus fumarii (strain DSM 11204 / 1A) TaxID=694429 RepID=G0EHE3_PYRF1|nr:ABC transporter ATP-binding protein [Pyrolobus fumarii]AEM38518.1 ABC transporter-related protein [Pyrolobus fumarii 1A]